MPKAAYFARVQCVQAHVQHPLPDDFENYRYETDQELRHAAATPIVAENAK